MLRHAYVTFRTWNVSCHIRISCVRTYLLPLAGTVRAHTLICVDWLANVLVVFGLRSTILYASRSDARSLNETAHECPVRSSIIFGL